MSAKGKRLIWFFVIFLAGTLAGFVVGGFTGGSFGMSLVINSALTKDAIDMNTQLQALRQLRDGNSGEAIELLEASVDDTLVIFDPAEPYPGIKEDTVAAINLAVKNAYEYRRSYPRSSDRPHVDNMVKSLFEKQNLTP